MALCGSPRSKRSGGTAEVLNGDHGLTGKGGCLAKLDFHRELRSGLTETVFAEGKRTDDLLAITERQLAPLPPAPAQPSSPPAQPTSPSSRRPPLALPGAVTRSRAITTSASPASAPARRAAGASPGRGRRRRRRHGRHPPLPTLVAGLLAAPVVAVPTSVGYGSGLGGLSALSTMLNACAPGLGVVNIDNGHGAALLASRILRGGRGGAG